MAWFSLELPPYSSRVVIVIVLSLLEEAREISLSTYIHYIASSTVERRRPKKLTRQHSIDDVEPRSIPEMRARAGETDVVTVGALIFFKKKTPFG
jgi:hypothetical protein